MARVVAALVALVALVVARAAAQGMPTVFATHMVLQAAPLSARLFGNVGVAGRSIVATLTVTAGGPANPQTFNATSDATGAWAIILPPQQASNDLAYRVEVDDRSVGTGVTFDDVLFGDVWICSGQSNMEMTLGMVYNAEAEVADSINYPTIRVLSPINNAQDSPQSDVPTRGPAPWSVASPASVGGSNYNYFSAVCYLFGRELSRSLNIPIGLISSAWGGTIVEAWMSPEALAQCSEEVKALNTTKPVRASTPKTRTIKMTAEPNDPSALWNGMITPYLQYTIKGATWYQGESNAGNPTGYACLFPAMIDDWRAKMQPDLGFYFVQLAPYNGGGALPALRQAQTTSEGLLQRMALAIDLWDPASPHGEIHPRGKAPLGKRLALQALATTYGRNVDAAGPVAIDAVAGADRIVRVTLGSRHPTQYFLKGLYDCAADCTATFQVADASGTWFNAASASITGDIVNVGFPASVTTATGVRFSWSDIPLCAIYDEQGLPTRPFSLSL